MKLFNKIKIISLLESKVASKEIFDYKLNDDKIKIRPYNNKEVSKPFYLDRSCLSDAELIKVLYREIPKNIEAHFKMEIRNVKLRRFLNEKD